jgi:hypothetical protein
MREFVFQSRDYAMVGILALAGAGYIILLFRQLL